MWWAGMVLKQGRLWSFKTYLFRCMWIANNYQQMTPLAFYYWNEKCWDLHRLYTLSFYQNVKYNCWCAILIAHQIVMAKHGGSCVHFSEISTCGRTSRETVSHPQCPPLPTLCKYLYPSTLLWQINCCNLWQQPGLINWCYLFCCWKCNDV